MKTGATYLGSSHAAPRQGRRGYVLLETVVATGLLVAGLAVIGAQLQGGQSAVHKSERLYRAMSLAETQLAELALGLIELDTVDEVQEEDFGPRYPEWGWRITIEETAVQDMFLLTLDILHTNRTDYDEDYDFDDAEVVYTVRAMRATPRPLDLQTDFGLSDKQAEDLADKLSQIGEGFDLHNFDFTILAKMPFDELVEILPPLLGAMGASVEDVLNALPPDVRKLIEESGLLDALGGEEESGDESAGQQTDDQNQSGQEDEEAPDQ